MKSRESTTDFIEAIKMIKDFLLLSVVLMTLYICKLFTKEK
jgi:hypothetical protein